MRVEVFLGRIFIALIATGLTLLLVEIVSIRLLPTRAPVEQRFPVEVFRKAQPYTMFGGTPNTSIEFEDENGLIYTETLNHLGYRGPEPVMPKAEDEYRIFVLGGSTVFLGDPPIPALLQEEFKQHSLDQVKVYNLGVISSVSGMELARLLFEVADLQPDLVVFYNGGNDIIGPFRHDPRPGYPFNFLVYENNPLVESNVGSYPALALLLYGSNLARYFLSDYFTEKFADIGHLRQAVNWGSEEWREQIAGVYVNNLLKADKVSQAFGADFIAFAQPILFFKDQPAPEEADLFGNSERRDYVLDVRQKIRAAIPKAAPQLGIKIVDLSDIYDKTSEQVFTDMIHTTQSSKSVIAQAMYESIMQYFSHKVTAAQRP